MTKIGTFLGDDNTSRPYGGIEQSYELRGERFEFEKHDYYDNAYRMKKCVSNPKIRLHFDWVVHEKDIRFGSILNL